MLSPETPMDTIAWTTENILLGITQQNAQSGRGNAVAAQSFESRTERGRPGKVRAEV